VRRLKGPTRPVIGESDRAAILAALGCVAYVATFDDDTPLALIEALRPDVLVKGGQYEIPKIVGYEFVTSYGGTVCTVPMVDGISTTRIVAKLNDTTPSKPTLAAPHFASETPATRPTPTFKRAG